MSNKKQTSVEWLWKWIMDNPFGSFQDGVNAYKQAQQLHRQEIYDSHIQGVHEGIMSEYEPIKGAEQYYKDNYDQQNRLQQSF